MAVVDQLQAPPSLQQVNMLSTAVPYAMCYARRSVITVI